MRILILGGHGKVALLAYPLLNQAGHTALGAIRNPAHAADVERAGGTHVLLDIESASTEEMAAAMEGVDAVVFSAGAGGGNPERTVAVDREAAIRSMDAASLAGVPRYVMVSYHGGGRVNRVGEDNGFFTYQEAKLAADSALAASDLDWTILGPGSLTLEPSPGGVSPAVARGDHPHTSRELVAQVITAVVGDARSYGRIMDFHDGALPIEEWIEGVASGELEGAEA